jgi:hypothetical protein
MRFACWIIKATHTNARTHTLTHRICNTHCFSTATMFLRRRPSITLYVQVHYLSRFFPKKKNCSTDLAEDSANHGLIWNSHLQTEKNHKTRYSHTLIRSRLEHCASRIKVQSFTMISPALNLVEMRCGKRHETLQP